MIPAPTRPHGRVVAWLVGSTDDHSRFLDLHRRFAARPTFGLLVGGSCLLVACWAGWVLAALVAVGMLVMGVALQVHQRVAAPEVVMACLFAAVELNLAVSASFSGGWDSPLLVLMALPAFSQGVCFRTPVTVTGVVASGLLATLAGVWPAAVVVPAWLHLPCYLALVAGLLVCVRYLADSDLKARDDAVVDTLTGLLNRKALESRLVDPAWSTVAVLMVDVDHFKRINDQHGHQAGDAVLRDLGRRLQDAAREGDTSFRLGGEEFLVLCGGATREDGAAVAERLRAAVAGTPLAGLPVTVSVGVAAGPATDLLAVTTLMAQADDALYAAKRAGRDNVHVGSPARPWSPAAEPLTHAG